MSRPADSCPCGSTREYEQCCQPLHIGSPAGSAEALMRSRYSAFCLDLPEYIERSWHSSTRPSKTDSAGIGTQKPEWIGLRVKRHKVIDADHALVEFIARYKISRQVFTLHEISRFVREHGHWFYLDGTPPGR